MVYFHILMLVAGLLLLVKGSDFFVEASSRIARRFGVSDFVIGLTLVAIGTSIPELSSSIAAALKRESGLIVGNVIGSNIANIGLILGTSVIVANILVKKTMLKRDAYMMIASAILFYIFAFNGLISRAESVVFLLVFFAYTMFLINSKESKELYDFRGFLNYFASFGYWEDMKKSTRRFSKSKKIKDKKKIFLDVGIIVLSLVAIIYGAKFLVDESIWIAELLKVPTNIIGITIVAVGTSLPELGVSLRAAKKGYGDLMLGNVIGSNITNILLILGVSSLINETQILKDTLMYSAPVMILFSVLLGIFMRRKYELRKLEGIILFVLYVIFIAAVVYFR